MNEPILTVLMVTYNHVNYIEKAIQSVLEQKTNFEYKIWILDDASTDGTSDIVRKYADLYPDKIFGIIQKENTKGAHIFENIKRIDTKYFATLECDDYWCDENKLQLQVDILENNLKYSCCCHNTYRKYPTNPEHPKHNKPYISPKVKSRKFSFPKKICRKQYIEPHYSSRVYRTSCLNLAKLKNPIMVCYDIASMFWFLSYGDMYYIDKLMSVYNFNYCGIYSGVGSDKQKLKSAKVINIINKEFDYKYNSMFLPFFKTRIRVSLTDSLSLKYFTPKSRLEGYYDKILTNYKNRLDGKINSKILCNISLPMPKNKALVLELRREKQN